MGSLRNLTNTKVNSAADSFDLSYAGTLPIPRVPIYTVPQLREALLGLSGSQAATLRNGKWISALNIPGYNNPALDTLTSLSSSDIMGIRDSFNLNNLSKLTTISFPALRNVGVTSNIQNLNALTTMSFPSLTTIGGSFQMSVLTSLVSYSFPSLISIGGTFQAGSTMAALTTISFPALVTVGSVFSLGGLPSLVSVSFPSLANVGGSFSLISFGSNSNSLTTINFPALVNVVSTFSATVNGFGSLGVLASVNYPALANVGSFTFNGGGNLNFLTTANFPALVNVGGSFTINGSAVSNTMNGFTTLLIGSTLKHINGDFVGSNVALDRHNAWSASTYYPSYASFTAPASAFSSTTTGTTCTVNIVNHGLQTGDIITVSGITSFNSAAHNFNTTSTTVAVTRISADIFTYTITATTQIPVGTATIQRQEVAVTPITKNGRKYICTTAGTSGASEPTWPTTVGNTVVDGTATWTCSELSLSNILSRLDSLDGTNGTTTYGANRFINIGPLSDLITINSISTSAGVATITTATNHGITTGTQIAISGCTGTALRYNGVWTATSTGLTTLTAPVPTDLNSIAGAGTMRLSASSPQFTGSTPIAASTIVGIAADSHMLSNITQLRDSEGGASLPIFVAGIYNRNGTTNGFAKYSCTENGWDIWYDTTSKRWVNSPSGFTGNAATVGDYLSTPQSVSLASTSSANPAVITSSVNHGLATGAVFTVVIEGCSNAALNGSWTATSTGATTFTIPVDGSAGATSGSGTVSVLNQAFNQGRLMSGSATAPVQGVQQTITTSASHGFSNGDFIHFYGASGTNAASVNDLNTSSTIKSMTSAITVINATSFTCVRYATIQPFVGSYSPTTMPHMRDPSINDTAFYTALKLRARGIAVSLRGTTGI
jgi:hypothetical protein